MSYFGKGQRKRIIQVPLDTSGIINLNHLDVIPMQFLNGLNDSTSINISLNDVNQTEDRSVCCKENKSKSSRVTPRKAVTIKSDRKALGGNSHSNLKIEKRQTRILPFPVETTSDITYSNSKVTLSPSFDRRGRMTRITTDYNQDSKNSEYYKQMRLGRRKHTKQNYLNYTDSSPGTSGVSSEEDFRITNIDKAQPIQYTSASISQCLNYLENYEEDAQNSAELDKLTETLEQLQKSCNNDLLLGLNPLQSDTNLVNSEDVFTLCPTEPIEFKCETSITDAPSNASEKSVEKNLNDQSVRDHFQLPDYFLADNSFEILVKGSSGLHGRKVADIWDWASPSYIRDASTFSATTLFNPLEERQSKVNLQITPKSSRKDSFSYGDNPLTKTQLQNDGLGKLIPTGEALLDLRSIQSNADELPLTPRTIFAPITSAVEDMLLKTTKTQQVTPPLTSCWSISPIYEAESVGNQSTEDSDLKLTEHISNSITGITEELNQVFSSCSLAAVVSSTASLADVHSSEDIPTCCSSNSTFSDFNEHEHDTSDGLSTMNDQRIQDLLAQFHETDEQKKTMSFGKYISSIVQKEADSGYELELPSTSLKSQTPEIFEKSRTSTNSKSNTEMVVNERLQPQSLNPSLQKTNEVEVAAVLDGNSIPFKTDSKISEHSMSNKSRKKEKKKEKGKKGKKDKEVNDVEEENKDKGRHHYKYNVTQTLAEQSIQKLKSALPRTPGGRYSLEGKAAEDAIAAFVKAELAASLECADTIPNRNSKSKTKPVYGNLGDFLRKVAAKDSKSKSKLNKGHTSNSKVSVKCASAKCRVPKYTSKPKPMIQERPKNIILPRQSNRINFIRYQQQSLAAMMHYSKSRNSKKPLLDTGIKDSSMNISTPNGKEYDDCLRARRDAFNNRFRTNRNVVTVVFDKAME